MSKILEGNILKKPNQTQTYTKKQIEELKKCSLGSKDPHLYFMENFGYLKHPEKGRLLFKPFDYQLKLINNYHNYRFSINMLGRQMGKCVARDTVITVRNKITGEVKRLNIEEFFNMIEAKNDHPQIYPTGN